MKKKLLQKSLTILFTAFIGMFLFGGILGGQNAYAVTPDPTIAEKTKVCEDAKGSYNSDGSCFIAGATDCKALGAGYEQKAPADNTGIVCQKSATGSVTNPEQEKVLKERIYFIIEAQKWLNAVIWPVLVMIGDLMNNDILFGAGMDERLREIWIPIRNLINLFFVLALVAIAIYNILGVGEDNDAYSIKQILPKMIIAIIAVNFSFLGIKVFLDGINVLTTSIFALPDQVKEGLGDITKNEEVVKRFCLGTMGKTVNEMPGGADSELDLSTYKILASKFVDEGDIDAVTQATSQAEVDNLISGLSSIDQENFKKAIIEEKNSRICTNDAKLTPRGKAFLKTYNSSNAALAMALNMSKIVFYQEIDITTLTAANISKLLTNTVFSVALYLIYVVSFLVLFIVLLARLVVMWLGVVASPIIIVSMILPVFKEKLELGELVDKFVQNAIAPILIAFSMTVGWIMLRAIQGVNSLSSESVKIVNGIPVAGLNTIQDLIVALGTVGVIWIAVSSAANKSIAEPVTKALYGALGQAGSFVGNIAWRHTPLFPVTIPSKDGTNEKINMTPGIIGDVLEKAERTFRSSQDEKAQHIAEAIGFGTPGDKPLSSLHNTNNSREALGILRNNEYKIRNGGKEVDKELTDYLKAPKGIKFKDDIEYKKDRKLYGLIKEYEKAKDDDKKAIRGKIADHLKHEGSKLDTELEAAEGDHTPAKGTPAAKPAPDVKENDKIGTAEIGKDHVKQIADATDKLVEALKNPNNKKGDDLKAQIKAFELNGQKPLLPQLKAFITDPEAKRRLGEIFHNDADLQKVLGAAQAPGAAIPKGAIPEQVGKPQQKELASAAPLPPVQPSKPSPAEAPLVGQPPQVADAGNKGQPPQQNAGPSENKPGEVPPVA